MTLKEFSEHCLVLCGKADEIVMRLNRLANGNYHCDFGDAIFIYRESLKLRDDLYEVYEAVAKAASK